MCYNDSEEPKECLRWFALSAPFHRELQARDLLASNNVEVFVPMKYFIVDAGHSKKKRELRPAVPNLLFARSSKNTLQNIKKNTSLFQYLTRPEDGRNCPIIVPDSQMNSFICAIENSMNNFLFFQPSEIDLSKGKKVRIVGGTLNGLCGTFMKVKGARARRLVIMLEGLGAVAAEVEPDFIELI